jgi:hypothetical protein
MDLQQFRNAFVVFYDENRVHVGRIRTIDLMEPIETVETQPRLKKGRQLERRIWIQYSLFSIIQNDIRKLHPAVSLFEVPHAGGFPHCEYHRERHALPYWYHA